jgi:hypothetical protein
MVLSFVGLILLSFAALFGAVAVAVRYEPEGRGEAGLVVALGWHALITLPILGLGWLNQLDRPRLAGAIVIASAIAFAATAPGGDYRGHAERSLTLARRLAALPIEALRETGKAKSVAFLGLAASIAIILYSGWISYLAPSIGWDGIWYHETIVGFSIQHHGFAFVPQPWGMEYVNGFPKICEALSLFFVLFLDRRLIDLPPTVMSVPMLLAMYVLARRATDDRNHAIGWAAAIFLMPGVVLELRSTYIDLHTAALYLGAAAFCARPKLRLRDGLFAALALAMLGGTKGHALTWIPPLALVVAVRLLLAHPKERGRALAVIAGGLSIVLLVTAPPYVRNWTRFHNPIWPVHLAVPALGVSWAGPNNVADMNKPLAELYKAILVAPVPGNDFPDTRTFGYGMAVPWAVVPAALLAYLAIAIELVRRRRIDASAKNLLIVTLPLLVTAKFSPALWSARYNVHVAAALMLAACWGAARKGFERVAEALVGFAIVTSLMMLIWAEPRWSVTFAQALQLARLPAEERAATSLIYWTIAPDVARARDRELGEGDVVAMTDEYRFPSLLWNERMSNAIVYVPSSNGDDLLRGLEQVKAKWVTVQIKSGRYQALKAHPERWQEIGKANANEPPIMAFRRVQ